MKERVKRVLNYKKPTFWIVIVAVAACFILAICFLTDPKSDAGSQESFVHSNEEISPTHNHSIAVVEEGEEWDFIPMVMVDGILYLDTGHESTVEARCGTMDGEISSQVSQNQKPTVDNQSNFGTGFGYQYGVTQGTIEVCMNGKWWVFATEEVLKEIQFPSNLTETNENSLDTAINKAILNHYASNKSDGLIHVESHILLANESVCGTPKVGEDHHKQKVIVYLLAFHESFRPDSDPSQPLESAGGDDIPIALTFHLSENGDYILDEYWEPRDGGYYTDDIKAKFPEEAQHGVWNDQDYVEALKKENRDKVRIILQEQGDFSVLAESLIATICSSPAASSNPGAYIQAHQAEYNKLLGYGEATLQYCFGKFLTGGQTGLEGYIMAELCQDIMAERWDMARADVLYENGQVWFDQFYANAQQNAANSSLEYLEKYDPASKLVLDMAGK